MKSTIYILNLKVYIILISQIVLQNINDFVES